MADQDLSPGAGAVQDNTVRLGPAGLKTAQVELVQLGPERFRPRLHMPATLAADPQHIAHIGAQHTGRVVGIAVGVGDSVRPGQALLEIDSVDMHHVSTEYLTALARTHEVEDVLRRQQQLSAENIGVVADLRRAEAAAQALQATLHETEEHLRFLGLTNAAIAGLRQGRGGELRSILRAPIEGRVEAMGVTLGQVLGGQEDVLTIIQLDRMWATLRLYERDLGAMALGAEVQLSVASYPGQRFIGTVAVISDLVDTTTRTVEARATVDNRARLLKPGMTAVASIARPLEAGVLWLPSTAVLRQRGGSWLFVAQAPGVFRAEPVQLGPEVDGLVPILQGPGLDARVVVQGALSLWGELERRGMQEAE